MKTKKYKLLKDLPDLKAGAIGEYIKHCEVYEFRCNKGFSSAIETYSKDTVENSPEWFEEVKEEKKRFTKIDMIDFALRFLAYKIDKPYTQIDEIFCEEHFDRWQMSKYKPITFDSKSKAPLMG